MLKNKRIAVLGGGHGAHTMAADLALKGYEVNLCEAPEFYEAFKTTIERQSVDLIDVWGKKKTAQLKQVTTDFKEALNGAAYIMMVVPALGARSFFERIMPYLEDGQTVIKWSGNFSALMFANMLKEKGIKKDITLAEGHTLPWGCRLVEPGVVQVMVWVTRLLLATLPASNIDRVIADVQEMYPVVPAKNVFETTLNNLNPIVHPVGTIMNAGWIDTVGENFYFYRDGNTLSISRGIKRVFEEVSRVSEEIGVQMIEYPEEDFWNKSAIMSTFTRAFFDKEGAVAKISGPASMQSRYISEDIPCGLVPISKLARQLCVPVPAIDAVIELASIVNQIDYMAEGISLEELGLDEPGKNGLQKLLHSKEFSPPIKYA